MRYKVIVYRVVVNGEIELGVGVVPAGVFSSGADIYLVCLEPAETSTGEGESDDD